MECRHDITPILTPPCQKDVMPCLLAVSPVDADEVASRHMRGQTSSDQIDPGASLREGLLMGPHRASHGARDLAPGCLLVNSRSDLVAETDWVHAITRSVLA